MPNSPNNQMSVKWTKPMADCQGYQIINEKVQPDVKPGASFGVGTHVIWYSYDMSNGMSTSCRAIVEVKGMK